MAFTLCQYMVVDKNKVKMEELTGSGGKKAVRVRATVEGLLPVETQMVLDGTSIVGGDLVADFRLLADNSQHSGTALSCSAAGVSDYLTVPSGGTLKVNITYDGGTLGVTISEAGDCGEDE